MLIVSFWLTITLLFLCVVLKFLEAQLKVRKRIDTFVNTERPDIKKEQVNARLLLKDKIKLFKSRTIMLKDKVANFKDITNGYFSKMISSQKEDELEIRILRAGSPFGMTTVDFQVIKMGMKVLLPVLFGGYAKLIGSSASIILIFILIGFALGRFIPDYYLNSKIKQRNKQALKELPDFLDLLTVSLEAGLGFDLALNKVISKRNGILSAEFHICLEEIRLGKTRKEALNGVKERLSFDELKSLINSILQAEKLGISIVHIFRIKSQEEREKRRQRAEEEAMKAPIKILFPLVLFIFPSIFIVILGPVVIQFIAVFNAK
jgi:tight adherence protein C